MVISSNPSSQPNPNAPTYAERAKKGNTSKPATGRTATNSSSSSTTFVTATEDDFPAVSQSAKPPSAPTSSNRKNTISYAQASSHNLPKNKGPANGSTGAPAPTSATASNPSQMREAIPGKVVPESSQGKHRDTLVKADRINRESSLQGGAWNVGSKSSSPRGHDATPHTSSSESSRVTSVQGQNHDRLRLNGEGEHSLDPSPEMETPTAEDDHSSGLPSRNSPTTGSPLLVQPELAPTHQALTVEANVEHGPASSSTYQNGYDANFALPNGYDASYFNPQRASYYSYPSSYSSSPGQTPPILSPPYPYGSGMPVPYPYFMMPYYPPGAIPPHYWSGYHSHPNSGHHTPAYTHYSATPPSLTNSQNHSNESSAPSSNASPNQIRRYNSNQGLARPAAPENSRPVSGYGLPESETDYSAESGPVVFGSVGTDKGSPSPPLDPAENPQAVSESGEDELAALSIGIAPGDENYPSFRSRSRTRSGVRSRTATVSDNGLLEVKEERITGEEVVLQTIDLANPDKSSWGFGTISAAMSSKGDEGPDAALVPAHKSQTEAKEAEPLSSSNAHPAASSIDSGRESPSDSFPGTSSKELHKRLEELSVAPPTLNGSSGSSGDAFPVQNYGYIGFGPGYWYPAMNGDAQRTGEHWVPRGSPAQGYRGRADGLTGPRRGYPTHESRGHYSGRRGRGHGRGNNRRGGGFQSQNQYRHPLFNNSSSGYRSSYYGSPFHGSGPHGGPYTNSGYGYQAYAGDSSQNVLPAPEHMGPVSAPAPVPVTKITFPLDPLRQHLLGHLEFYLNPQNIPNEKRLRKKMDDEGWIPLSELVKYGHISQYNANVDLVRNVLILSSLVELGDNSVRVLGWEPPAKSATDSSDEEKERAPEPAETNTEPSNVAFSATDNDHENTSDDEVEYDSEDEDIEIVINQESP